MDALGFATVSLAAFAVVQWSLSAARLRTLGLAAVTAALAIQWLHTTSTTGTPFVVQLLQR
jgi:hypothetical protein